MTQNTLYIPVEIQKNRIDNVAVKPYSLNKYSENPFIQCNTQVQSLTDQKKKLLNWLKSINLVQRRQIFTFTSKQFTLLVRAMYERKKNYFQTSFRIVQEQETNLLVLYGKQHTYRIRNSVEDQAQQELINNLMIISRDELFDSVGLHQIILSNVEKLFQIFEVIEDGISNEVSVDQYKFFEKESNQIFFYKKGETQHYKKSLGKCLVQVLKKHIWCQYYQNSLESISQYKKIKEKRKYNKIWKELSTDQKIQILKLQNYKQIIQQLNREKSSSRIKAEVLPKINNPNEQQIQQFIKQLSENKQIEIYEYLTECPVKQSCQEITCIRWILLQKLKKQILQYKTIKMMKKKKLKLKKKKTEQTTQPIQPFESDKQMTRIQFANRIQTQQKQKSIKKKVEEQIKIDQKPKQLSKNKVKLKKTKKYQQKKFEKSKKEEKKSKSKSITSNETNETNIFNNEQQQQISEQELQRRRAIIQSVYNDKLKSDIVELSDSISQLANSYVPYRIIAFNRIQYLLNIWRISIKIFGSCATGLALANSDIDIAVDPSILNYFYSVFASNRQKVILALNSIVKVLENRPWVSNIKLITTASIPILKFQILPNIPFQQNPKDSFLNLLKQKQKSKKIIIKVDLTIQYFYNLVGEESNHLGIMATNLMNQWMTIYPSLHTVSLILKYLLKKRQFCNIYKGGISSYCLIVMVIAFLNTKNMTEENSISKVFYGFLEYFTTQFQHNKMGIDIRKENATFPFYQLESPTFEKIIVKDPLNGKIITLNSYQYEKILQQFSRLKNLRKKIENQLNKYIVNAQLKLPEKSKYFTKNYLQEYFNDL